VALVLAAIVRSTGFRVGLMATAFGFGFRHGIDWDHIAALTDITSSQESTRTSMFFATLYALGHALVVMVLGLAAIVLSAHLPKSVDRVMEHFVGASLVALGIYVFYALIKHGRDFRMRSRWMLILSGVRRAFRWARGRVEKIEVTHEHEHRVEELHQHDHVPVPVSAARSVATERVHSHRHRHIAAVPDDPFMTYGKGTAFGIGMLHGVGAETPTQILIFLAAAGAGGKGAGVLLLVCFLVGLLSSNTVVALASTFGFMGAGRNWKLYAGISVLTASFSLVIGTLFLLGRSTMLPAIFGG
jgi:high-affinity nickel permease